MDILPIAYHFIKQFETTLGKSVKGLDDIATSRLLAYDWPGNVRQLRNVIERAMILCEGDRIGIQDLPLFGQDDDLENLAEQIPATNEEFKQLKKEIRQKAVLKIEKNFILNALTRNDWNVTQAAQATGLQRTNLQSLMKKHGIKLTDRSLNQSSRDK